MRNEETRAGKRDALIAIEGQGADTDDGFTRQPGAWVELFKEWATVRYGTGAERRQAAQESATISATFGVVANASTRTITTRHRIAYNGLWNIIAVAPSGTSKIVLTAVQSQ
jgi:head-tail adaptor